MSRAIRVLLVGGVLLTGAACGTAPNAPTATGASSAPSAPPAIAATCEALAQAYGKNMAPLAQSLSDLVADRKAVAPAQQALAAFATAVQDATKGSEDRQVRADGKQAADQMRAKSTDKAFFSTIKKPEDVDKTIGPTLTEWLAPVQRHCT
ncbi:hypothetical protein AB0F81_09415 [Actinoplanes sp. NPDC024001]|uniref:hypothetical protein n=1 Tax=Actinoplanes sp. NPDC024001 TaxID=3154598 RepID=UPI0033E45950